MDVKNTFLNGILQETVYLKPPPGTDISPSHVCKLNKSLYGLKQAPRAWFERLCKLLLTSGYIQAPEDYSLFSQLTPNGITVLLVYVDDLLITGSDSQSIVALKAMLSKSFFIKDLGCLTYYLGIECLTTKNGKYLRQTKCIHELL